jgi:deoxyhypusine monooxygenase
MDISALRTSLLDLSESVAKRTQCAFHLRTMNTVAAMNVIADALKQREDGELMRHELAYILGQMQLLEAIPTLTTILEDESENILVRHESAEALGALGELSSLEVLNKYKDHEAPEIAETCQIAIDLIHYRHEQNNGQQEEKSEFLSVDPAPGFKNNENTNININEIEKIYMDTKLSLFQRYRAMFSLRDINTDETALILTKGLNDHSALFRHEVAYVIGQLMRRVTIPALSIALRDINEHNMVRHEAAEALGAIGTSDAEEVLKEYAENSSDNVPDVIKESCIVALDAADYWKKEEF